MNSLIVLKTQKKITKENIMGFMDMLKEWLGRARESATDNIRERVSDTAREHLPDAAGNASEGASDIGFEKGE
jgi:phage terminase small subunit